MPSEAVAPLVWFDFGGVLSPSLADLFASYERRTGIAREQLERAMAAAARPGDAHPLAPVELGLVSEREWARGIARELSRLYPQLDLGRADFDAFGRQWFDGHVAQPQVHALLRELHAGGVRLGLLTNNVPEWGPHWRAVAAADGLVEHVVNSCEVGVRKPDAEIFALAAERAQVRASDCVLVDDLAENCAAARAAGWRTVHHVDSAHGVADVKRLLAWPPHRSDTDLGDD